MLQQRLFAFCPDSGDAVQSRHQRIVAPFDPVRSDNKTVRFVAQTLNIMQQRIVKFQIQRRPVGKMQRFLAGVSVNAFGHPDGGNVRNVQLF